MSPVESPVDERTLAGDESDWLPSDDELRRLQWRTALYYLHVTNPFNGLVRDKTVPLPKMLAA